MPSRSAEPEEETPGGSPSVVQDALHDLNNMLAAIRFSLQGLRRRIDPAAPDQSRLIENGLLGTERALALGRLLSSLQLPPVRPAAAVDVHALLRSLTQPRRLQSAVALELAAEPAVVHCDAEALEGGLAALLAALATVAERLQLSTVLADGGRPALEVAIRGEAEAAPEPATGLALAALYGCMMAAGGSLVADFRAPPAFVIRLALPLEASMTEKSSSPVTAATATVLVVEDEELIRLLIVETLEEQGYQVLSAGDGEAALQIIQSGTPLDLLATDVGLPGMDGRQLAAAARGGRPGLKILLMTGHAEPAGPGGMEVLTKPFDIDVLSAKLRAMLAPGG